MTQTPQDRPVKGWVTEIVATTPRPGLATVKVQALSRRMTGHAAMCPEHRSDWVATRRGLRRAGAITGGIKQRQPRHAWRLASAEQLFVQVMRPVGGSWPGRGRFRRAGVAVRLSGRAGRGRQRS